MCVSVYAWIYIMSFGPLIWNILKTNKNLYERVCSVIYWPSTEPSIKRCTSVNKRKNSGSWWTLDNDITRCLDSSSQLETGCQSENQLQTEGFGPSVIHGWATQTKMQKKCCLGQYSSLSLSPLISHTHNKHHLFENKVWEIYIFIKKCIRSLLNLSLSVDYVPVYICICMHVVSCTTVAKMI